MSMTGSSVTPQPYRGTDWQQRYALESEIWDAQSNVVYGVKLTDHTVAATTTQSLGTLTVPCPVVSRLEFTCRADVGIPGAGGTFAQLRVFVDGTEVLPLSSPSPGGNIYPTTNAGYLDVNPGVHTFEVFGTTGAAGGADYGFVNGVLTVRRGRKPPT